MNNIPFNSAQNVINVARELNLTIPEAQMLIQRASQGVQIPQRGVGLAPNPYKDYYIEPSRKQ